MKALYRRSWTSSGSSLGSDEDGSQPAWPTGLISKSTENARLEPVRSLGRGSFGNVILAKRPDNRDVDQLFAVKLIPKSRLNSAAQTRRTETELRILTEVAPLLCDRLVVCRYAYQSDNLLVCVMDYAGRDLRKCLQECGRFQELKTGRICLDVYEGVSFLHSQGILYRDLKPENILIGEDGAVRLADFGLSTFLTKQQPRAKCIFGRSPRHYTNTEWSMARTACGTPVYQSPELVKRTKYQFEVDWWAFGVVLYEMLVGVPPFYASCVSDVHRAILYNPLEIPAWISSDAKALLVGLLDKNRQMRLSFEKSEIKKSTFFRKHARCSRSELVSGLFPKKNDCEGDFAPELIAASKKHFHVKGFEPLPETMFAGLVSVDMRGETASTHSSAFCTI